MSRRRVKWRRKLGYDPMPDTKSLKNKVKVKREAYMLSQCGGSMDKLRQTIPSNMRRPLPL